MLKVNIFCIFTVHVDLLYCVRVSFALRQHFAHGFCFDLCVVVVASGL